MQPARPGSEVKALIEFIARQGDVRLELHVAEEDMGRVIGRAGRVANAMRTLLRVAAAQRGVRANLDIL